MGFSRLLIMDRRGCGLSDPRTRAMSLEDEARDVLAVLDAAGSERAVLMGYTTGGPLAIATAALAPERVQALVLYASMARAVADDDVDWANTREGRRAMWAQLAEEWGTGANLEQIAPLARRRPADAGVAGAPGAPVLEPRRARAADGRLRRPATSAHLLGELRVPTLILHRTGDRMIDVRHSRYLAERIPGARYVELEGVDNLPGAVDSSDVLGEIEEFLTGGRSRTRRARAADRDLQRHRRLDRPRRAHGRRAAGASCSAPTRPPCAARSTASAAARSRRSATPS